MTSQRQVILRAFVESDIRHLSAEEVYDIVKKRAPEIGLATVYRTLELFTEMDLLKKLDFDDGCSRFELNDREDEGHYHHHLICLDCGKVIEVKDDLLETLETILKKRLHFETVDHQLKVYGYCEDCQRKRRKEKRILMREVRTTQGTYSYTGPSVFHSHIGQIMAYLGYSKQHRNETAGAMISVKETARGIMVKAVLSSVVTVNRMQLTSHGVRLCGKVLRITSSIGGKRPFNCRQVRGGRSLVCGRRNLFTAFWTGMTVKTT